MATKKEILNILTDWAPTETALDFDNVGLLVDSETDSINKVAVCLDITPETILAAKKNGAELIVSHHPVIFSPLKKLSNDNPAVMLIKSGIAAICMHTNLDAADGGVNDALAEKIEQEWYDSYRLAMQNMYDPDAILPDDLYVFDSSMNWCVVFTHETTDWESEIDDPLKAAESRYCIICNLS